MKNIRKTLDVYSIEQGRSTANLTAGLNNYAKQQKRNNELRNEILTQNSNKLCAKVCALVKQIQEIVTLAQLCQQNDINLREFSFPNWTNRIVLVTLNKDSKLITHLGIVASSSPNQLFVTDGKECKVYENYKYLLTPQTNLIPSCDQLNRFLIEFDRFNYLFRNYISEVLQKAADDEKSLKAQLDEALRS